MDKVKTIDALMNSYKESFDLLIGESLENIAKMLCKANTIFIAGNGGSVSTATHFAADIKRLGVSALSLGDNMSAITAIANDLGYEYIFVKQLSNIKENDMLIVISVSGDSRNLIKAVNFVNKRGVNTFAMLGRDGGILRNICDKHICVSSADFGLVESIHVCLCHMLRILIKEEMDRNKMNKAVFLDRDGTINKEVNYCSSPEAFEILPGVTKAIGLLNEFGFKTIILTNQSGIARGFFTEETLTKIHEKMYMIFSRSGALIDGIYYCPHGPEDNCDCRKPKLGMALQAIQKHGIVLGKSFIIGDTQSDMDFARALGCRGIMITPERNLLNIVEEEILI